MGGSRHGSRGQSQVLSSSAEPCASPASGALRHPWVSQGPWPEWEMPGSPAAQGESVHLNEALMQADSSDGRHGWTMSAPKDKGTQQGQCCVGPGHCLSTLHLPDRRWPFLGHTRPVCGDQTRATLQGGEQHSPQRQRTPLGPRRGWADGCGFLGCRAGSSRGRLPSLCRMPHLPRAQHRMGKKPRDRSQLKGRTSRRTKQAGASGHSMWSQGTTVVAAGVAPMG